MWRDASTPSTGDTDAGDVDDMGDVQVEDLDVRAGCSSSTNTKYFPPDLVASTTVAQEEEACHMSLDPQLCGSIFEEKTCHMSLQENTCNAAAGMIHTF
jgi:hypothetical protein